MTTKPKSDTTSIRILIVDDHRIFSESLSSLLSAQPDMKVVGLAERGDKAVSLAHSLSPDIVLLDISLPDISGIMVAKQILSESAGVKILPLSMHLNKELVQKMITVGACGFLAKNCMLTELLTGIRAVMDGKSYLCSSATEVVMQDYIKGKTGTGKGLSLTDREQEVLKCIANGYSTKKIAKQLDINPKTVETHRRMVMKKLNIFNVAELTKYALRKGMTTLDPDCFSNGDAQNWHEKPIA